MADDKIKFPCHGLEAPPLKKGAPVTNFRAAHLLPNALVYHSSVGAFFERLPTQLVGHFKGGVVDYFLSGAPPTNTLVKKEPRWSIFERLIYYQMR